MTAADPTDAAQKSGEEDLEKYGFLALMRALEQRSSNKPRIGRNSRTSQEIVRLGQDPFLAFPDADLSSVELSGNRPSVRPRFLGFFGPHGALPLNTTEEVLRWHQMGDAAFIEFTDIFATRFIQLFYRSWADAKAITQFDHASDDRFQKYLLSFLGLGTHAFQQQAGADDTLRLGYAGLGLGRIKSPVRLAQILQLHLATDVEIEELIPNWMAFEPDSLSRIGMQGSTLGQDIHLGSRVLSIGEKIRINVYTTTLEKYRRFLPGGADHLRLWVAVLGYLGLQFEVEVAVWLPQSEVAAANLGTTVQVGWMACVAPPEGGDAIVKGTTYRLALEDNPKVAA